MATLPCGTFVHYHGLQNPNPGTHCTTSSVFLSSHCCTSKWLSASSCSTLFSSDYSHASFISLPRKDFYHYKQSRSRLIVRAGRNYYSVLGVEENARKSDIKSAYKRLARTYHPDVNKSIQKLLLSGQTHLSDPTLLSKGSCQSRRLQVLLQFCMHVIANKMRARVYTKGTIHSSKLDGRKWETKRKGAAKWTVGKDKGPSHLPHGTCVKKKVLSFFNCYI